MPRFITSLLFLQLLSCQQEEPPSPDPASDCALTAGEQTIVDQLNAGLAYPFNGANPEEEDAQLMPLINYLSATKLVGLGEATHGTAEFYQLKDKLFRLLVTEAGFKAIIFEIPWGNALVVNDFVTEGIGTVDEVIDQTFYWTYDTQEVRDLAQWLHDYNQGRANEDKIYFVGCDPQGAGFNPAYLRTNFTQDIPLRRVYDVLIHFDTTTESVLQ